MDLRIGDIVKITDKETAFTQGVVEVIDVVGDRATCQITQLPITDKFVEYRSRGGRSYYLNQMVFVRDGQFTKLGWRKAINSSGVYYLGDERPVKNGH